MLCCTGDESRQRHWYPWCFFLRDKAPWKARVDHLYVTLQCRVFIVHAGAFSLAPRSTATANPDHCCLCSCCCLLLLLPSDYCLVLLFLVAVGSVLLLSSAAVAGWLLSSAAIPVGFYSSPAVFFCWSSSDSSGPAIFDIYFDSNYMYVYPLEVADRSSGTQL